MTINDITIISISLIIIIIIKIIIIIITITIITIALALDNKDLYLPSDFLEVDNDIYDRYLYRDN